MWSDTHCNTYSIHKAAPTAFLYVHSRGDVLAEADYVFCWMYSGHTISHSFAEEIVSEKEP